MGTKKISELTELETLSNDDLVAVVDVANEATKKMTAKKLGAATGIPTNAIIGYDGNTIPSGYEEIDGNAMITAKPSLDKTYTSDRQYYSTTITELYAVTSKTNKITINSNSAFVIGTNISKVKVSANIGCVDGSIDSIIGFQFVKTRNGIESAINEGFTKTASTYPIFEFALTPYLIDVQEGDIIDLKIYFEDSGKSMTVRTRGTFITIEEV